MDSSQNLDLTSPERIQHDEVQTVGNESHQESQQEIPSSSSQVPNTDSKKQARSLGAQSEESCAKAVLPPETEDTTDETGASGNAAFQDCPICLQPCIHPARLPCGHIFCFLCIKGVAYKNQRCAMCRREIPAEFLERPQLVNGVEDICKLRCTDDGYQWFYEGRNGGWWAYDKRSSDEIEEVYSIYLKADVVDLSKHAHHDMLITGTIYSIDFVDMVQYPKNIPMRRRKICRAKHLPTKGVAGIQFCWWQYDIRTSQDIEDAYKNCEKSCTILVAGYVYIIDLESMVQQRQNEPTKCRRVKRDLANAPKKGVAGLRIDSVETVETVQAENSIATDLESFQLLDDSDLVENSALDRLPSSSSLGLARNPSTSRQSSHDPVPIALASALGRTSTELTNRLPPHSHMTSSTATATSTNFSRQGIMSYSAEIVDSTAAAPIEGSSDFATNDVQSRISEPHSRQHVDNVENMINDFQRMSVQISSPTNEEALESQPLTRSRNYRTRF